MKNVWWNRLLFILFLSITLLSCKQQAKKVNKQLKESSIEYDYFNTKAKVKYSNDSDAVSASLSFRMKNGETIWASLSKFGKEAIRIKLQNDSAYFLNKYPADERFYSIFPTQEYLKKSGFNLDFKSMQNLIFGIHPLPIEKEDTVTISDSIVHLIQWRSNVRLETELFPENSRIMTLKTIANNGKDTVSTSFDNYKLINNHYIPTLLKVRASTEKEGKREIANSEINYSKPKFTSEPVSFSFKIPKGYEKR